MIENEWTPGNAPDVEGRYEITVENVVGGEIQIGVKIDQWNLKKWHKKSSQEANITAYRIYQTEPYRSDAFKEALVRKAREQVNKATKELEKLEAE